MTEHLAAVHDQMSWLVALPDCPIDIQDVAQSTLRMQVGRQDAAVEPATPMPCTQKDRPGAVAEQYAGAAILPVQDPGINLTADHQDATGLASADHPVGNRQRVNESGTG